MKKRLFRFTYVLGTTMNNHITSFNQLVTDLMNMDEVFKDQDLSMILLGSLPDEFELLETTLLNGKDDVSLSEVCAALYSQELRKKDKHISSTGDVHKRKAPDKDGDPSQGNDQAKMNVPFVTKKVIRKKIVRN